jgi:elongation factor Ts
MAYTATDVKNLRERTGAGMMDCKKALDESAGDFEAAVDALRAKGLAAAAKKSSRTAAEGLVGVAVNGTTGVAVEVNSETDFVAKNEQFQDFVRKTTEVALGAANDDVEALKAAIATVGENIALRRVAKLTVKRGVIGSYIHGAVAPGQGKIGVLVGLESDGDTGKLEAIGKQIAMHIAAANPLAVRVEDLDPEVVARERAIFTEQARESGKPEAVIAKMVEGRLRKFYEEAVLLAQAFVVDAEKTVEEAVASAALGTPVRISRFVAFRLGEGIDKPPTDFAAEVAAVTNPDG